jgi:hypothetical protein
VEQDAIMSGLFRCGSVESVRSLQPAFALLVFLDEAGDPGLRVGVSGRKLVQGEPKRDRRNGNVEATLLASRDIN